MIFWISKLLIQFFTKTYFHGKCINKSNFPKTGPFIIAVNHNSFMDVFAVSLVVKSKVRTMAKHSLFEVPVLKWWLNAVGMFPVIRNASDTDAFNNALEYLKRNEIIFIAPEGTRKKENGQYPRPKTGFIRLALLADCQILPVAIWGTDKVLPPGAKLPKPNKIAVMVGQPLKLEKINVNKDNKELLQEQASNIMNIIYKMNNQLDQKYGAA